MVYGLIAMTLFCLTLKGYCGKRISTHVTGFGDSFLFNLIRMLFCILIGAAFVCFEGAQNHLGVEWRMLLICAFSGAANAAFLVGWLFAVQKNTMVSVDVGLTLGSILPAVLCAMLFAEAISIPKMLGFAVILGATVILAGHGPKKATSAKGILLLVIAAVGDGLCGFTQQLYRQCYTEGGVWSHGVYYPKTVYHFYTYVFAALLLLAIWFGYRMSASGKAEAVANKAAQRATLPPRILLHISIMAVCLFAANYLQTVVTNDYAMPSQVLYPVIKGGCLITVNFVAMLFFGEKITPRSLVGSFVALVGIVCMNIL